MGLEIQILKRRLAEGRKRIKRRRIIKGSIEYLYLNLKRYVDKDIIVKAHVWETPSEAKVEIIIQHPQSKEIDNDENIALEVAKYLP